MNQPDPRSEMTEVVEAALTQSFPGVELVDIEMHGGRNATVTVYIDRPGGVDVELCAAVATALDTIRERHALQVSSPGLDRPLRTAAHFTHARGERAYVKTLAPVDGRAVYRGRITRAGEQEFELALDEGGAVVLAYADLARAHVIFDFDSNGGRRE